MPILKLPTGQTIAVPDPIAPPLEPDMASLAAGPAAPVPELSPAAKAAKVAQWVAFKDQQYRETNPDLTPEELEKRAEMNRKKYESFLSQPAPPPPPVAVDRNKVAYNVVQGLRSPYAAAAFLHSISTPPPTPGEQELARENMSANILGAMPAGPWVGAFGKATRPDPEVARAAVHEMIKGGK